jgi:hypothetical protein
MPILKPTFMRSNHTELLLTLCVVFISGCGLGAKNPEALPTAEQQPYPIPAIPADKSGEWLAGDFHVHTDHSSDGSALRQGLDGRGQGNVSVADQIGQGVLNQLSWLPLTDHRTYDQHYDPLWESVDLLLIPGEEANGSPHANVFAHVDWLIQGAVVGDRPAWSVLQTSIWDAHTQGAVWSHNHPDDGQMNEDGSLNERANAVGFDITEIWNKASHIDNELNYAELQWNRGYRFGGAGSSDNHFRELWANAGPGLPATHVFSQASTERAILSGMVAGNTTIQNRIDSVTPFVVLEGDFNNDGVFETLGGDEVVVAAGTEVPLRIRINGGVGTTVSLYQNPGRAAGAVASFSPADVESSFSHTITSLATHEYYYVEVRGPGEVDSVDTNSIEDPEYIGDPESGSDERRAITSPIFVGPSLATPQPDQAVPADAGTPDAASLKIGLVGSFSGFPDIAVSAGTSHVVAEIHSDTQTQIAYTRNNGAPIVLSGESGSARFAKVAAQGETVWVAWQDERNGQVPRRPAIYLRQSTDGGQTWRDEIQLRSIAGRAEKPDLAILSDTTPVIVWQEIRAEQPFDVFLQHLGTDADPINISRAGKSFNAATPDDTRSALYPASIWPKVAVRADGLIAVAFHDNRTDIDPGWTGQTFVGDGTEVDNWQIRVISRPTNGSFSALAELGDNEMADRHPDLDFAANGDLVVVWDQKTQNASGTSPSIQHAVSNDDGVSFATPATPAIAFLENAHSQYPRLGRDSDASLRAVWYDNRASDWRWRVMTAHQSNDGSWSAGRLLHSPGINSWPATTNGLITFASTRNTQREQRDNTQQIFVVSAQ